MKEFIHHLTERNYQKRIIGLMENGSWAPVVKNKITKAFELCKNLEFAETVVTIHSAVKDDTIEQIKKLKEAYPSYFEKCVSFNSVLHSKSNVGRIVDFFEKEFGKTPMLSELSRQNVVDKALFNDMFLNVQAAIKLSGRQDFIDKKLMYVSPNVSALTSYLHRYTNETFKDYRSMFYGTHRYSLIPTGTCIPFNRKLLVTTNGKIMVCEHIDHNYAVGKVDVVLVEHVVDSVNVEIIDINGGQVVVAHSYNIGSNYIHNFDC